MITTSLNFSIPGKPDEYQVEDNADFAGLFLDAGDSHRARPGLHGRRSARRSKGGDRHGSDGAKLWPGEDPIGKILREGKDTDLQIVGIARDAQVSHLGEKTKLYVYLPAGPKEQSQLHLMIRGGGGFAAVAAGVRDAASGLDPDVMVDVTRLEDNLEVWRTPARIVAALAGSLGALGLLLASIGVYGVVSYAVSRRTREIGIRMTLGADGRDVMNLMLRQSMRPVLIGGAIGIAGCAAVSWVLSSMLFGISARDPIAFLFVPAFLLGIALLASYVPARRATRVNPVVALRYE